MSSLPLLKKRLPTKISYVITILSPNFILLVTFLKESLSSYNRFMSQNSYFDFLQSAFRKGHSNETGLKSLTIYMRKFLPHYIVKWFSLILICAFDSLGHDILISRLEMIVINGSALNRLNSYILNRSSSVKVCDFTSDPTSIEALYSILYGIPHGTVIGPLIFSIYSTYKVYYITISWRFLSYI